MSSPTSSPTSSHTPLPTSPTSPTGPTQEISTSVHTDVASIHALILVDLPVLLKTSSRCHSPDTSTIPPSATTRHAFTCDVVTGNSKSGKPIKQPFTFDLLLDSNFIPERESRAPSTNPSHTGSSYHTSPSDTDESTSITITSVTDDTHTHSGTNVGVTGRITLIPAPHGTTKLTLEVSGPTATAGASSSAFIGA